MSYFSNKPKATAESIAGVLTNKVKENLADERDKYEGKLGDVPSLNQWFGEHKFSGDGVDSIKGKVAESFGNYNTYSRFKVQESAKERKELFNLGSE